MEKNWKEETKAENAGRQSIGYDLLSLYRSELMGLAILCVIMFHAVNLGLPMPVLNIVWSHGFLGVDIFILLSSMGLSLSLSRRKQNLREFYTRRLIRILPAYWLVAGCCGLFLRKVGETGFEGMFWTLSTLSLWLRHPELNYFDWYIPALLVLYLVMPLCYTLLKRTKYRLSVCAVFYILSIAISSRMPYVMDLSSLIYRIPTFMLGIVIGLYIAEGRVLTIPKMLLWGAGLIAAPILRELLAQVGISLLDGYCFTLYGVFVCLTIACLLWYLPEKGLRSFLRIIGESSLEIYLFNMVLIVLHSHLVNLLPFGASQVSYHVIVITADILLGLGLHRLLQPVTKWLTAKLCPAELNSDYKFLFQASPDPDWTKKKRNCFWAWNLSWVLASGFMVGIFALLLAPGPGNSDMVKNLFRDVQVLALNILPILFLNLILYALIRRAWAAFSINAVIVLGFSVVNYFKIMIRDDPLMFADLLLFKEARNIVNNGNYKLSLDARLTGFFICVIAIAAFLYFLVRGRPQRVGVLSGITLLAGILGLALLTPKLMDVELYQKINAEKWVPTRDYVSHGFVYPFIHSITDVIETPPPGYNEEEIASLLNAYPETDIPDEKKVNVIAVMLEAYNDFSKFDVPGLSPDVYKVWHDLEEEGYSGDLVTDIFGGGTVDTERCFLTGYQKVDNFRSNVNAYPWYFRAQGYRVEGFHPYYPWFYNRENINSYLGFENYYFNDNLASFATDVTDPFSSDEVLFSEILKGYRRSVAKGWPYFNYSLSYQGHGSYGSERYAWGERGSFVADDGTYTDKQHCMLENYFGSIASTNKSLRKLTDSLRADTEPVVLILFGDHNPALGTDLYSALGINLDTSTEEGFRNYYSTRYIIWANDAAKEILGNDFRGEGPVIGPYFLMNQVFELCGWKGSSYLQAVEPVLDKIQVAHTTGNYYTDGVFTDELNIEDAAVFNVYRSLEYYQRREFRYKDVVSSSTDSLGKRFHSTHTNNWYDDPIVAHALGTVDGRVGTNSKEAFIESYGRGMRTFEVDLQLTSDGYLIARHDWEQISYYNLEQNFVGVMDLETFLNTPICFHYTPLSADDLVSLLEEYPDMYLITDSKDTDEETVRAQMRALREAVERTGNLDLWDRLIIQIYHEEMYEWVEEEAPVTNWIFTLYQIVNPNYDEIGAFCKEHGIDVVTLASERATSEHYETLHRYGCLVYAHTVNRLIAMQAMAHCTDGYYSDYVTPGELKSVIGQ